METQIPLKQHQEAYVFAYPQAADFAEKQNSVFWPHTEIKVEKDKQDILVNMTPAERHGVITTLKLFTKYELIVGEDYWGGIIAKRYPRPEIVQMASCFAYFELNVHAPFYDKINKVLGIATEEFYNSYIDDPVLRDRIEFIDSIVGGANELLALAGFAHIEGAVLYSNFAYLKHFQSQGKNKLMNVVRGINFSVRDENLHAEAGAWLFRTHLEEANLTKEEKAELVKLIDDIGHKVVEHEDRIIDKLFELGEIEGINAKDMKIFARSRVNKVREYLELPRLFQLDVNPIADWFYKGINNFQFNDFFSGMGNQYQRDWSRAGFAWKGRK